MVILQCNKCGQKLRAPESMSGQSVKCPKCGEPFTISSTEKRNAPEMESAESFTPRYSLGRAFIGAAAYLCFFAWAISLLAIETIWPGMFFAFFLLLIAALQVARCGDILEDIRKQLAESDTRQRPE